MIFYLYKYKYNIVSNKKNIYLLLKKTFSSSIVCKTNSDDNTDSDTYTSRDSLQPSTWNYDEEVEKQQGKTHEEIDAYFEERKSILEAAHKKFMDEHGEDNEGQTWESIDRFSFNRAEEEVIHIRALKDLKDVRQHVLDYYQLNDNNDDSSDKGDSSDKAGSSGKGDSPNGGDDSDAMSTDSSDKNNSSLIDDYADPSLFPMDWTTGDD